MQCLEMTLTLMRGSEGVCDETCYNYKSKTEERSSIVAVDESESSDEDEDESSMSQMMRMRTTLSLRVERNEWHMEGKMTTFECV